MLCGNTVMWFFYALPQQEPHCHCYRAEKMLTVWIFELSEYDWIFYYNKVIPIKPHNTQRLKRKHELRDTHWYGWWHLSEAGFIKAYCIFSLVRCCEKVCSAGANQEEHKSSSHICQKKQKHFDYPQDVWEHILLTDETKAERFGRYMSMSLWAQAKKHLTMIWQASTQKFLPRKTQPVIWLRGQLLFHRGPHRFAQLFFPLINKVII